MMFRIKPLEDIPLWARVLVAILAVVLAVSLLLLVSEGGAQGQQETIEIYQGVPLDRKFLELDKKALDQAYNDHLLLLFGVWLKSGDGDGARRFSNGMKIARNAYSLASKEIAKREQLSEERERELDLRPQREPRRK
jgi:hypothetical protein